MKYSAINIGPVVPTISMGRKPREIWAASYLFSFLMECIIKQLPQDSIISPATLETDEKETDEKLGIGLYPDRIFVKGEVDADVIIDEALKTFEETTKINRSYFNVMHVTIDGDDSSNDAKTIKRLNQLLDCTELYNRPVSDGARNEVLKLIQKKTGSPLFKQAFKSENSDKFEIPYLAEIATKRLEGLNKNAWTRLRDKYKCKDSNNDGDEDLFYQELKENFKQTYNEDYFSYYKYICIVQADGDNMGKIVSSISADNVLKVSKALLEYGKLACKEIKSYGGLPIYAGGDDLLFIAPVNGKNNNIFGLIDKIDKLYADEVDISIDDFRPKDDDDKPIHTYLSYGLSISYYKYPLYEAFKSVLDLLFEKSKKEVKGKNAVSWQLRKHSGSGFNGEISKSNDIYNGLKAIIYASVEEKQISAIAHKLKNNENLLDILLNKYLKDKNYDDLKARLENFYKKTMEDTGDNKYTALTRELLLKFMCAADEKTKIETILGNMYGMLRTAKFIKGEGDKDE